MSVGTPHCARLAIIWAYPVSTNTAEMTLYLEDGTDNIFTDLNAYLTLIHTFVSSRIPPLQSTLWSLTELSIEDVRTVPFGGVQRPYVPPVAGALSPTSNLPSNAAFALKKLTGAIGRSGRGRAFWPVTSVNDLTDPDTVSAARAALYIAAMAGLQADIEGASTPASVGIVSYVHNKVPRSAGLFQRITSWSYTDLALDTQRRRLEGH